MNIIIVGQGSMGLLWYHHFNNVDNNLTRKSTKKRISTQLSLLTSKEEKELEQPYSFIPFEKNKPYQGKIKYAKRDDLQNADIIVFCLKSYQIKDAIVTIANQINVNAILILAHNGMGTLTELPAFLLKRHTILALLTTHACLRIKAFAVKHTGIGKTDIGVLSGELSPQKQEQLIFLFNKALPTAEFHQNIKDKQWLKLAINAVINPITALNNIENGGVTNEKFNQTIDDILTEIVTIAKAENINLAFSTLKEAVQDVAQATAKNSSSMRCDLLAHRKTEVDYINGYIHLLGLKHKIATPTNTKMWQKIKVLESNY